jgi:hypothetical protein
MRAFVKFLRLSIPVCVLSASMARLPIAECVLNKPITATRLLDAIHRHAGA